MNNTRIIHKDNSVLRDYSVSLANFLSGTQVIAYVAAEDALYIGSDLPFNHRWVEVSVASATTSALSVYLWNGSAWEAAVDVVDETSVAGVALARSGFISWVPDRLKTWSFEDTTERISDLSTLKIYDKYWAKLSYSADLTGTTALKYVGHKFCNDEDLTSEYPDLAASDFKTAYAAGKTSWSDQIFSASEYIVQDLKAMGIVWSANQILESMTFKKAAIHKSAEIIFRAMGEAYKDNMALASKAYGASMNIKMFNVDKNRDARLSEHEKKEAVGFMTR